MSATSGAAGGGSEADPGPVRPPNLLVVMADQLAAPFLAVHGGPAITPNLDRLVAEGTTFASTYSTSPLCAPARVAMMTGRLCSRTGAYDNAAEFAASIPTFAHHLRAGGYRTTLIGKMHFVGPDQLHGFEERLTTDIYPADFGWTPDWSDPEGRFDRWFHDMSSVERAGAVDASNQLDFDDEVGFRAVRHLRDLARSPDPRPWATVVSFTHPHDPYVARREWWDRYEGVDIPPPAVAPIPEAELDAHSRRLRHVIGLDATTISEERTLAARRAYLANVSYVDHHLGELLAVLERHGMDESTVVVVTADHGDLLGERGLWYKMAFFEHACRIPLVVRAPGTPGGVVDATHVGLVDLAPTLLELAGLPGDPTSDGRSVVPLLGSRAGEDRTVLGEYLAEGAIAPLLMLRRDRWKLTWSAPDGATLHDLVDDPDERRDLAGSPEHAALVAELVAEVRDRWDVDAIDRAVRVSQRERRVVDAALRRGRHRPWDHQPGDDASEQYMRNHLDLGALEASRRA